VRAAEGRCAWNKARPDPRAPTMDSSSSRLGWSWPRNARKIAFSGDLAANWDLEMQEPDACERSRRCSRPSTLRARTDSEEMAEALPKTLAEAPETRARPLPALPRRSWWDKFKDGAVAVDGKTWPSVYLLPPGPDDGPCVVGIRPAEPRLQSRSCSHRATFPHRRTHRRSAR
jgi:hypothetical protein